MQARWACSKKYRSVLACAENRCEVLDYLLLCRTKPDLAEEDVYEAYSEIMGLMYAVPKIVVGFTGPISSVRNVNSETDEQATPFRHAMHFRLADRCEHVCKVGFCKPQQGLSVCSVLNQPLIVLQRHVHSSHFLSTELLRKEGLTLCSS